MRGRGTDTDLESTRATFHVAAFPHSRSGNTDSTGHIASKVGAGICENILRHPPSHQPTISMQVETRHREDDAPSSLGIEYDATKGDNQARVYVLCDVLSQQI